MGSGRCRRWLKAIAIAAGCIIGIPVAILLCILGALTIPSVQQKAVTKAASILTQETGIPVSVGHFSVGLPLNVLLSDVFVGDGQNDTLAFVGCLDARLKVESLQDSLAVNSLDLHDVIAHTGDLIPTVKIDGRVGRLSAGVKAFNPKNLYFPVTDAVLEDVDLTLELISPEENSAPSDSSAVPVFIDLQDITLRNVDFRLEPVGLRLDFSKVKTSTLLDLGAQCFTVRSIDVEDTDFSVTGFELFVGRLCGDVIVDIGENIISSERLYASVPRLDAQATLYGTRLDLETMLVSTRAKGSFSGSGLSLNADYDIDDERFRADIDLERTDIAKILGIAGSEIVVAGNVKASGCGINPTDMRMKADVQAQLDSCRYNTINVSGVKLAASLSNGGISGTIASPVHYKDSSIVATLTHNSHFILSNFLGKLPGIALDTRIADLDLRIPGDTLAVPVMDVRFKTGADHSNASIAMHGLDLRADAALHALEIPSIIPSFDGKITLARIDTLLSRIPKVDLDLSISQDNPFRSLLQKRNLDLNKLSASLHSVDESRKILLSLRTPALEGELKLPAINADLDAVLARSSTGPVLDGNLRLEDLAYDGKVFGDRTVRFDVCPDINDPGHLAAHAQLDDIPLEIAQQFVTLPEELGIHGELRARAAVFGLPDRADVFAGVTPVGVSAEYKPFDVKLCMGNQEITMKNNRVDLNGLRIFAADSTFISLNGGLDLQTMNLDVLLNSERFEPVKLPKNGPIPVYGTLLTSLDGSVTGPVDSLMACVDVSILPETDVTYPIDKKNLAQVCTAGTVRVGFNPQTGLKLNGQIDVPKGMIFFSPAIYPMMPFNIDKGSCIRFNGDLEHTELAVSASQGAKATYKPVGEVSRMVDFVTGVKVGGTLEKIDIGFYLDAPDDAAIHKELAEMPQENREGLAAVLLATGMYASDSNEAAQMEGYALSSIVQSKLNAAASNRLGNVVNLDFGVAKGKHGRGVETTDYTVNVSKSFFNDKLSIKLGGSVSDNEEVNKNSGSFLNNISAEYKLDSAGAFKARLFSKRDFQNIVDGELVRSGAGVLYGKTIDARRDSLDRSLDLEVEGDIVYRSNNQLGPDASATLIKRNLFSREDIFTAKIKGAYYWNLNRREQKDPGRNDTYILGADFALNFPYLQLGDWTRKYTGQTQYRLGYLNENISGDYGMHKLYGGVDYSVRQNRYITHSFSPLYLSIVLADRASENLTKNLEFTDLLKLFANNEFIPSAGYSFSYNNYRNNKLSVNTALDFRLKESANLISGIMAACGRDFNERDKTLLGVNYDQFVKLHLELRNKFKLTETLELATRALAGAVITYGNSVGAPLSEAYSIGGSNSLRAFSPRTIGPGDFHNGNYSSQIFHTGDMKLEMNAELRFPIFWKVNGAVFVDAGNVWNQRNPQTYMTTDEIEAMLKAFNLTQMYNSHIDAASFLRQIALGTGAGLRLDYESIVLRLDLGIAIHAPYDTGRAGYYNIPNFWKDGLRLNFGIGYPF